MLLHTDTFVTHSQTEVLMGLLTVCYMALSLLFSIEQPPARALLPPRPLLKCVPGYESIYSRAQRMADMSQCEGLEHLLPTTPNIESALSKIKVYLVTVKGLTGSPAAAVTSYVGGAEEHSPQYIPNTLQPCLPDCSQHNQTTAQLLSNNTTTTPAAFTRAAPAEQPCVSRRAAKN